jgi:hypothetical protein
VGAARIGEIRTIRSQREGTLGLQRKKMVAKKIVEKNWANLMGLILSFNRPVSGLSS